MMMMMRRILSQHHQKGRQKGLVHAKKYCLYERFIPTLPVSTLINLTYSIYIYNLTYSILFILWILYLLFLFHIHTFTNRKRKRDQLDVHSFLSNNNNSNLTERRSKLRCSRQKKVPTCPRAFFRLRLNLQCLKRRCIGGRRMPKVCESGSRLKDCKEVSKRECTWVRG